jgi:UDP-N-acetylmuramoyl-tripeptide--D-alanyl-D-alanine ligase
MHPRVYRALPKRARWAVRRAVLARPVRRHLARCNGVTFVAVTGSLGKTTAKDLIATALATEGPTTKTAGTFNSLDGVPATLMAVRPDDRFAVLEVGIGDQPGEMRWMAGLFEPAVAVLTMVTNDHVNAYGTTERVAREKRSLLERVGAAGTVVVDVDDPLCRAAAEGLRATVVRTGTAPDADVRVVGAQLAWPHGLDVELDVFGDRVEGRVGLHAFHLAPLVASAVAATTACGMGAGATLDALRDFVPYQARMRPAPGPNGSFVLADDWKSRPHSARAAVRALGDVPAARRIAVLGEIQNEPQVVETYGDLAELLQGRADLLVAVGRCAEPYRQLLAGTELGRTMIALERASEVASFFGAELREGDVALLHGGARQHLARARLRLERDDVRCDIRRCKFGYLCDSCPFLTEPAPPAPFVELA